MEQHRLIYLLEGYAAQTISIAEKEELTNILKKSEFSSLQELLGGYWQQEQLPEQAFSLDALTNQIDAILSVDQTVEHATISSFPPQILTHRVHFLKTGWLRYAAAILLLVGIGSYLWLFNKKTEQLSVKNNRHLQTDIAPGRDRAILTLANGQQIVLDSTQGNVIKQNNLTVINLAGKLKYEGVGIATEYNTLSTPNGGQYQVVLPDGSKVWLNAASSIKFPTAFLGNERKVEITGEAYMEIAKNNKQPFSVKANETEIQVLGTNFNVNAYKDEPAIKTTLISGSVKVISNANAVILKPSQQAVVNTVNENPGNPKIRLITVQTANTEQALAWKNGIFQFNWTSLAEAMRQLARWYDVEVIYENGVPDIKLEGDIKRNLSLPQVLSGLGKLGVKYRMEGKRLFVLQ